jgi:hypothetical protein
MNLASTVRKMRVGDCQVLQLESTSALLVDLIWRPFSISNPEDRVLFMERTFMCLVRARRSGGRFPGLKPWAESCNPFGAASSGRMTLNTYE